MTQQDELLLIDISGLAHQLFHVSGSEPDPNFISIGLVKRVRELSANHPHAALCCDKGKSLRKDLDPTYKAQRDTENRGVIAHQVLLACERLEAEGYPVWAVAGYEADDLIATATTEALKVDGTTVRIASNDKDLLQLVNERVTVLSTRSGDLLGPTEVFAKYKIEPKQMRDFLTLVGDSSDNIKGAEGIGAVKAANLLAHGRTLDDVYGEMAGGVVNGITPAMRSSLMAFKERLPLVRDLITLRIDAPIPFHEIAVERTAHPATTDPAIETEEHTMDEMQDILPTLTAPTPEPASPEREMTAAEATDALGAAAQKVAERIAQPIPEPAATTPRQEIVGLPAPLAAVDFSQELEPRTMNDAWRMAQRAFASRLFSAYGTPEGVMMTILAGREFGMGSMAALRAFHVIEGKPSMSAGTIAALVLKSGKAQYFRCSERTPERATYVTQRGDDPPIALTYTIEEAKQAWSRTADAWAKSTWGRSPADMLVARASSKLARLVYPDVVSGLYAPEEFE